MRPKGRIDPWEVSELKDYRQIMEEFGIQSFDEFSEEFPSNHYVRRGIIFGHRDFRRIAAHIKGRKPFLMVTGLMPSGKFHLGHKVVADQMKWYQCLGAKLYVCSADLEAYLMRGIDFQTSRQLTIEEYLTNYFALGVEEKGLHFWLQSDYRVEYYRLRDVLSRRVTLRELEAIYGDLTPGKMLAVLTQVADILHPQLEEFEGPMPTVVPVGVDQDPHLRLARDLAKRFKAELKVETPSVTYHKLMRGLQGGKMSSSQPKSYVALNEEPKVVIEKVMEAKTGGQPTVKEQRERGGKPEDCSIYDLFYYHFIPNDEELFRVEENCRSGDMICGECKASCCELILNFLEHHQEKLPDAKERARALVGEKGEDRGR